MPVTDVREIRVLPPLAIGRFGGSQEPMHNYEAMAGAAAGYRSLVPSETLILATDTGEIVARRTPPAIAFKDGAGLVKPVCPFLEVWALFDGETELRPLTLTELGELGRGPEHLSWEVKLANLKMLRRTGQPGDRVEANLPGLLRPQPPRTARRRRQFQGGAVRAFRLGAVRQTHAGVSGDPPPLRAAGRTGLRAHGR